jgi:anaerobic magnesium-protoporphyrin IX monomethyl ester cyclase
VRTPYVERWGEIPNAWVRCGESLSPPSRAFVANLGELTTPSYDGLDLDAYLAPRPVLLQSSRGCYWGRCAFCVHTFQAHACETPRVRLRPLELVGADIDRLVSRYAPRYLAFGDVSISPARMKQLCQLMIDRALAIPWFAFLRLDRGFDRPLLERMRQAGCLKLNFGLESGSARILGLLEKGHDLDTARRIIDDALDLGFRVTLHTMAALPGETRQDFEQTLALIEHYAPRVHETGTEVFRLERGTRIFQSPERYQIKIHDAGKSFDNSIPFENPQGLGQQEAMRLLNERLYGFYRDRPDLIYRARSNVGLRHKDDFALPSHFRARCRLRLGALDFDEQVMVATRGGGILQKLDPGEDRSHA